MSSELNKNFEVRDKFDQLFETQKAKGQALANLMGYLFNSLSTKELENGFIESFMFLHKTLQQQIMGLVIKLLKAMAETDNVDGRNEAAHEMSKIAYKAIKDAGFDVLPFI